MSNATNNATILGQIESEVSMYDGNIAGFMVRTDKKFIPKGSNEEQVRSEKHQIFVYGDKAQAVSQLNKGDSVFVQGFVRTRQIENNNVPFKVYLTEVIVDVNSGIAFGVSNPASHINEVRLVGNFGKDGELVNTTSSPILNLSVATARYDFTAQQDKTDWHRVSMFGKRAESLSNACKKGSSVTLVGELQTRYWKDDATGFDRHSTDIVISSFDGDLKFIGGRSGNRNTQTQGSGTQQGAHQPQNTPA